MGLNFSFKYFVEYKYFIIQKIVNKNENKMYKKNRIIKIILQDVPPLPIPTYQKKKKLNLIIFEHGQKNFKREMTRPKLLKNPI